MSRIAFAVLHPNQDNFSATFPEQVHLLTHCMRQLVHFEHQYMPDKLNYGHFVKRSHVSPLPEHYQRKEYPYCIFQAMIRHCTDSAMKSFAFVFNCLMLI